MGKTVIITGASKGIGLAIAQYLVKEGHNVVMSARTLALLEKFQAEYPKHTRILAKDATDPVLGKQVVELAHQEFGQLDGLIINHGMLAPVERVANSSVEEWKRHFDVNLFSAIPIIEAAIPSLRKTKGRIILTSSGAAEYSNATWGAYCASKAALKSLGGTIGKEEKDIVTVSIAPGVVDTEMQIELRDRHMHKMDEPDADKFRNLRKEGKMLKPEQPGNVMARLILNAPAELSGQMFRWDGEEAVAFQDKA